MIGHSYEEVNQIMRKNGKKAGEPVPKRDHVYVPVMPLSGITSLSPTAYAETRKHWQHIVDMASPDDTTVTLASQLQVLPDGHLVAHAAIVREGAISSIVTARDIDPASAFRAAGISALNQVYQKNGSSF